MSYKKSRGFTLVEIIVAMMIIAISAIATLEFYRFCLKRFVGVSRLSLEATDFGRDNMEGLYFINSANLNDGTVAEPLPNSIPGVFPNELKDNYGGVRQYTITSKTAYKVIETKVDWAPE